jgi:hypothetical protein
VPEINARDSGTNQSNWRVLRKYPPKISLSDNTYKISEGAAHDRNGSCIEGDDIGSKTRILTGERRLGKPAARPTVLLACAVAQTDERRTLAREVRRSIVVRRRK